MTSVLPWMTVLTLSTMVRNNSAKVGVSRGAGSRPSTMATGVCSIGNSSLLVCRARARPGWLRVRPVVSARRWRTGADRLSGRRALAGSVWAGEEARIRRLGDAAGRVRGTGALAPARGCGAATAPVVAGGAAPRAADGADGLASAPAVPARALTGLPRIPARDDVRLGRSP